MNGSNPKLPQKRRYDMPKYVVPAKRSRIPQPENSVAMLNKLGLPVLSPLNPSHNVNFTSDEHMENDHPITPPSEINMSGSNTKLPQKRRYDMPEYDVAPKKARIPQPENSVTMLNKLGLPVLSPLNPSDNVDFTSDEPPEYYVSKSAIVEFDCNSANNNSLQHQITPPYKINMNWSYRMSPQQRRYYMPKYTVPSKWSRIPQPKSTVSMLNELRLGLSYKLESQSGPLHASLYTISVEVDGQKYFGQGCSKKVARSEAAATALQSVKYGAVLSQLELSENLDFTSDEPPEYYVSKSTDSNSANNNSLQHPITPPYEINNGTGPSKKSARQAAAKAALASLRNISYSPMAVPQKNGMLSIGDDLSSIELPQIHADTIGRLVLRKFMEVTKHQRAYSSRKVLAGIVMTEDMSFCDAKVISVTTGTKCVSGEHISVNGAVLNDSHAEIVSRRCLLKYLYAQLDLHCEPATADQSIFVRTTDGQYPYKLKSGLHFHLYINTAPCGDGRIFSLNENDTDDTGVDKHATRKTRGQLRTKTESREGTIPVKRSDGIQTWDGVLQGERLRTMSCSDKIARWNILGIQGSLLSSIIEPIYLHSIVLGSLFHPVHMYRAVCGRLKNSIQDLPPPYHLNKPLLALVTSVERRNLAKAPIFGINWTIGDTELEVVESKTGRTIGGQISRITKQAFFVKYGLLIKNLPGIPVRQVTTDYGQTKANVKDYQKAKVELFSAFEREDLGSWLKKPIEQDEFGLAE